MKKKITIILALLAAATLLISTPFKAKAGTTDESTPQMNEVFIGYFEDLLSASGVPGVELYMVTADISYGLDPLIVKPFDVTDESNPIELFGTGMDGAYVNECGNKWANDLKEIMEPLEEAQTACPDDIYNANIGIYNCSQAPDKFTACCQRKIKEEALEATINSYNGYQEIGCIFLRVVDFDAFSQYLDTIEDADFPPSLETLNQSLDLDSKIILELHNSSGLLGQTSIIDFSNAVNGEMAYVNAIFEGLEENANTILNDDNPNNDWIAEFQNYLHDQYSELVDEHDKDGVPLDADNCPYHYNPDQKDTDKDGYGDVCDYDIDGDGEIDNYTTSITDSSTGTNDYYSGNSSRAGGSCSLIPGAVNGTGAPVAGILFSALLAGIFLRFKKKDS